MKKSLCLGVAMAALLCSLPSSAQAQERGRGGVMGFIAGCCFGPRAAADYNEGKEIHFREWLRIFGVFAIWDGVDGMSGKTRDDFRNEYGSTFY